MNTVVLKEKKPIVEHQVFAWKKKNTFFAAKYTKKCKFLTFFETIETPNKKHKNIIDFSKSIKKKKLKQMSPKACAITSSSFYKYQMNFFLIYRCKKTKVIIY